MNTGLPSRAVDQNSQIKFFLDRQRLFNQQPAHDAALGAGLMRHQLHAQHLVGEIARLAHRLGDLHAAAFAASAGMNLRLDHHAGRAGVEQFSGRGLGFFPRSRHRPARHGHTILLKNSFCLVLMNFHNDALCIAS